MGELKQCPVQVRRGASETFNISLLDPDGGTYVLQEGEVLRYGVKRFSADPQLRIKKILGPGDMKNGVYPIVLKPSETLGMETGDYRYDFGVQSGDDYWPCIAVSPWVLTDHVTEPEVNTDG